MVERSRVCSNRGTGNYDAIQIGIGDPGCGTCHTMERDNLVYDNGPDIDRAAATRSIWAGETLNPATI